MSDNDVKPGQVLTSTKDGMAMMVVAISDDGTASCVRAPQWDGFASLVRWLPDQRDCHTVLSGVVDTAILNDFRDRHSH
jgi:hypothetical protein